jgi:hypothetical protein
MYTKGFPDITSRSEPDYAFNPYIHPKDYVESYLFDEYFLAITAFFGERIGVSNPKAWEKGRIITIKSAKKSHRGLATRRFYLASAPCTELHCLVFDHLNKQIVLVSLEDINICKPKKYKKRVR